MQAVLRTLQAFVLASSLVLMPVSTMRVLQVDAERVVAARGTDFVASRELRARVDFWKTIFTKYGEHQLVIHYRSHPEIVYSVLDFSEYVGKISPVKLERIKDKEVSAEIKRVQQTLLQLGKGSVANTPFARRIHRLFEQHLGTTSAEFLAASELEEIRSQTGIREKMVEAIRRSGRLIPMMEEVFSQAGLPVELARVPFVESSFDYKAYSAKGAAGVWQFMRRTGKSYMRISASIDERRDPLTSTRAAARYLAYSYSKLGSWPLSVTSYNHGLSGVLRAVRETGTEDITTIIKHYKGTTFGFASANFYTSFLAALEVEQDWKMYFPNLTRDVPWSFEEVRLSHATSYRKLVQLSGLDEEEFHLNNLALLDPIRKGNVLVPVGFIIKVPQGGSVELAAKLGELRAGTKLKIPPSANRKLKERSRSASVSVEIIENEPTQRVYVVKSGDTLSAIAKKLGLSVLALQKSNPSADKKIYPGQKLSY